MSLDEFCDAVMWLVILACAVLGLTVLAVVVMLGTLGRGIVAALRWLWRPCQ